MLALPPWQVGLEGIGAPVDTLIAPPRVDLRNSRLLRGHNATSVIKMHNVSDAPAVFSFSGMTDDVQLQPDSGVLHPGDSPLPRDSPSRKQFFQNCHDMSASSVSSMPGAPHDAKLSAILCEATQWAYYIIYFYIQHVSSKGLAGTDPRMAPFGAH